MTPTTGTTYNLRIIGYADCAVCPLAGEGAIVGHCAGDAAVPTLGGVVIRYSGMAVEDVQVVG